jgi:hypothetical protein
MRSNFIARHWRQILNIMSGVALLYILIWILTFKPQMPVEYRQAIDSLSKTNKLLIEKQQELEEAIGTYEIELHSIDSDVNALEDKKTEINNYYGEMSKKATDYTPTQVDSFFKARYLY